MARKLAGTRGLGPDDVLISREDLEELQGLLYGLETALEDVESDLAGSREDAKAYREALDWLVSAATPLAAFWLQPLAVHGDSKLAPSADSTT